MRKFGLLIAIIGFLFSVSVISAQDAAIQTTITQGAKLRGGPGVDFVWLWTLPVGMPFHVDGQAPGGGWVRGITSDGKIGWIIATATSLSADQLNALPRFWIDAPFNLSPIPSEFTSSPASEFAPPPDYTPPAGEQPAAPAEQAAPAADPAVSTAGLADGLPVETGNNVRVRQAPSTDAPVLEQISTGTRVVLDGRDATQEWVRGTTPSGVKGWMATRFMIITGEQVAALPVVEGGASGAPAAPAAAAGSTEPTPVPAGNLPPPITSNSPVRGFSYGGHVQGLSAQTVAAMRLAGMTWVKKQLRFFQGMGPDAAAGMIADAHANGFRIVLGIVGAPGELNNGGYFESYASFVGGIAALGADAIEVWNEPNIDREWPAGQIDPGRFTQLLAQAYNAIKGANPNTMVISGAPAPTGFFGGCTGAGCDDAQFISGMATAGAARYMDCVGIHYNEGILGPDQTSGDPRGSSSFYSRYFWGMVNTYWNAMRGARPLCFTELGYLTPEGFPPLPGGFAWAQNVTVAQQAAWLDRAVQLSASSGKVRLLIVWNVDFTSYGDDPMGGYAIIRPGGACPACEALGS